MNVEIPYSDDQANAHIDMCLYGLGYGIVTGEYEYITEQLKKRGINTPYTYVEMNDAKSVHVVRIV